MVLFDTCSVGWLLGSPAYRVMFHRFRSHGSYFGFFFIPKLFSFKYVTYASVHSSAYETSETERERDKEKRMSERERGTFRH